MLSKRRLKRGVFRSVVDLQAAINRVLDDHNANSKPFQWVAAPAKPSPPSNTGIKRWIRSTNDPESTSHCGCRRADP
jgi:hypothetical protein